MAGPAQASSFRLGLVGEGRYEGNLFRLTQKQREQLPHDGEDFIGSVRLGGGVSADLRAVSLNIEAGLQKNVFQYNDELDNSEYDLKIDAGYKARSGDATLSIRQERRASSFDSLSVGASNLQTRTILDAAGSRAVLGDIRLVGGAIFTRSSNSSERVRVSDYSRADVRLGIGYYSPTGNIASLEGSLARSEGRDDRFAVINQILTPYRSDYSEASVQVRIDWTASAIWSIKTRVGLTRHNDESLLNADFRGVTGKADIAWLPTSTIKVSLTGDRSFSSENQLFSNGIKVTSVGASVSAEITDAFHAQIFANRRWRQFRYDLEFDDPIAASRKERLDTAGIIASYATASGIRLQIEADYYRRRASTTVSGYNAFQTRISAEWVLGR